MIWGDQRALRHFKSEIEISNDKLFFIKNIVTGSTQAKWYLVQLKMEQSNLIEMRDYGVYRCWWDIRNHKDCTQNRTMECCFLTDIRDMKQDSTLGKTFPVKPLRLKVFVNRYQEYLWYQDDIYLADNRLVRRSQFVTTGRKKLKYPNMIDVKQWKELYKEGWKKGINT